MASNDHGRCPACNADLNGGSIYDHFRTSGDGHEEALRKAQLFGATEHSGQWGRQTAIYSSEHDRTIAWRCPDCLHEWPRQAQQTEGER